MAKNFDLSIGCHVARLFFPFPNQLKKENKAVWQRKTNEFYKVIKNEALFGCHPM